MNTEYLFNKVVIWGHKLHTHTHSYIHGAFYKAFNHLGYDVLWLSDEDDVSGVDFSNSLFLTEGQVDKNIPIVKGCKYIIHNCNVQKYETVDYLCLQVYTNGKENSLGYTGEKIESCVYYDNSTKTLYQPWATDLLPSEIETYLIEKNNKTIGWMGSIWGGYHGNDTEIMPLIESCKKFGYQFSYLKPGSCSFEDNKKMISDVEIAPAIVGRWQKVNGYIPCRIFKNISYGKLGITNSQEVFDLFEGNVLLGNGDKIIERYLAIPSDIQKSMFINASMLIKQKHTYLSRIERIMKLL